MLPQPKNYGDDVFQKRLSERYDKIYSLYSAIYHNDKMFESMIDMIFDFYQKRSTKLKTLDEERLKDPKWYCKNDSIAFQFYAEKFAGNIRNIETKLDYIQNLGAKIVHVLPFLRSPPGKSDGGFAISDYRNIREDLGTIDDLQHLIDVLHDRGMCFSMDFVLNHTSDEHEWAKKAKKGEIEYQNRYYFYDSWYEPNMFDSYGGLGHFFGDIAPDNFTFVPECQKIVMTTFYPFQWDLNFANPIVFNEQLGNILYLLNLGVDIIIFNAAAVLWKKPGTSCRNLPQSYMIDKIIDLAMEIVCPGTAASFDIKRHKKRPKNINLNDQNQSQSQSQAHKIKSKSDKESQSSSDSESKSSSDNESKSSSDSESKSSSDNESKSSSDNESKSSSDNERKANSDNDNERSNSDDNDDKERLSNDGDGGVGYDYVGGGRLGGIDDYGIDDESESENEREFIITASGVITIDAAADLKLLKIGLENEEEDASDNDHLDYNLDPSEEIGKIHVNVGWVSRLWASLAFNDAHSITYSINAICNRYAGDCFSTLVHNHDDINWGLGFDVENNSLIGNGKGEDDGFRGGIISLYRYLNDYYAGKLEGSFSVGRTFAEDLVTGKARICGTTASLLGLESALKKCKWLQKKMKSSEKVQNSLISSLNIAKRNVQTSIDRILLMHSVALSMPSLVSIYYGDEIGTLNDYSFLEDEELARDIRFLIRGRFDWESAALIEKDESCYQSQIFNGIKKLIDARKKCPHFTESIKTVFIKSFTLNAYFKEIESDKSYLNKDNGKYEIDRTLLIFKRMCGGGKFLLFVFNFSQLKRNVHIDINNVNGRFREMVSGQVFDQVNDFTIKSYGYYWFEPI